jgi:hypothetical protein
MAGLLDRVIDGQAHYAQMAVLTNMAAYSAAWSW